MQASWVFRASLAQTFGAHLRKCHRCSGLAQVLGASCEHCKCLRPNLCEHCRHLGPYLYERCRHQRPHLVSIMGACGLTCMSVQGLICTSTVGACSPTCKSAQGHAHHGCTCRFHKTIPSSLPFQATNPKRLGNSALDSRIYHSLVVENLEVYKSLYCFSCF